MNESPYYYFHHRCPICGTWFRAKDRNYKPTCSDKCAMARWRESVKAMLTKSGPMYEKWKTRTEAARRHQERQQGG